MSEENWKSKVVAVPADVDKTPVAQEIWCYSGAEKAFTWHVVVNHDANGFVDRVQCKTSGTIHKYKKQNKALASASKPSASKVVKRLVATTTAAKLSVNLEERWFEGIKAWGNKVVSEYSPDKVFMAGEVFSHSSFGKGIVQTRRDNKIDVLFRTGFKTLSSRQAPL